MNLALWAIIVILFGYFIGSLHGSKMAQWLSGVNIKEQGVKNSGASNATIVLGWKYGALVALIDIGKSLLAVLFMHYCLNDTFYSNEQIMSLLFLTGMAVVIGHNYPVWMNFNGGKGTASVIGVLFALDWKMGLVGLTLLIVTTLMTDYLLVGVLFLYLTFTGYTLWFTEGFVPLLVAITLFTLAMWKHKENMVRIKGGTEPRISTVLKKKKGATSSR
ncbi:MAG: glycerol-3-phosphate acyltransferase [Paenisporosarcina sp.]